MGVLQAETAEFNLGITLGQAVAVGVRVAEQVGRIQHPDATHARQGGAGDVEAGENVGVLVEKAVAIAVLKHGDFVSPLWSARRRRRHLVKFGAQVRVVADDLQAGGKLVLPVEGDPHSPLGVPARVQRLLHGWLGGHEVNGEVGAQLESFHRFLSRCRRGVIGQRASAGEGLNDLLNLLVAGHFLSAGGGNMDQEQGGQEASVHGKRGKTRPSGYSCG